MHELPATERIFKADMVLLALGFIGPEQTVSKLLGVKHDIRSTVLTSKGKFDTNIKKVYAAGGKIFTLKRSENQAQ